MAEAASWTRLDEQLVGGGVAAPRGSHAPSILPERGERQGNVRDPPASRAARANPAGAWQDALMARFSTLVAAVLGVSAVALGAFGAHGLEAALEGAPDAARRLEWWHTGSLYHLLHAPAALGLAYFAEAQPRLTRAAAVTFAIGVGLFSGTLYAMSLGAPRVLGAVTPLGGLGLMAGWVLVGALGVRAHAR